MKFNPDIRNKIESVVYITFAWTIFSMMQFFISYATMLDYGLTINVPFWIAIKTNLLAGLVAGVLGGSVLVFIWEPWIRNLTYGKALKYIIISYTLVFFLINTLISIFYLSALKDLPFTHPEVISECLDRLVSPTQIIPFFVWLSIVLLTIIALLVNDKYGPGVFRKFLMGKYFKPQREERVFMFLDLKSSTKTAEVLGEKKYFNFIRDVFRLSTPGILKHQGEIYQYVGDEVVISWLIDDAVENTNCIECYGTIQELLEEERDYFQSQYGIFPEFKAGLHYGFVMVGEVGILKREIAYSGDVLNTTSRIQNKCNEFGVNILISKFLIDKLGLKEGVLNLKALGEINLRGKEKPVSLFTI